MDWGTGERIEGPAPFQASGAKQANKCIMKDSSPWKKPQSYLAVCSILLLLLKLTDQGRKLRVGNLG